ncbi:MAG: CDGSH iron-sulfur domain-containing protein [Sphingomonas sp.]|uniref:ferritin-like domain-containing protein n=1 Tax=Sphingomonas sp. TaxID=28214 RepID=UPI0035A827F1|nr:CDGSH iron-sulfur domain-containing protein [Sphingomonas sp.]
MTDAIADSVPASREQLWGVLFEAAEIEHNLMCCYLYAMFSLKDSVDEGVTEEELAAIKRWRGEILDVAIEEMAHLAIVSNILSALGAPAHFGRQNFPIAPGYHPAGVVVKLAPFNVQTLDHFIYLERPDTVEMADGEGFAPERDYVRTLASDRLMSATMDYATVGKLYQAIEDGISGLAASIGEDALFVGDEAHQIGPDVVALPNLTIVRCVKSAIAAIDAIVRQGEGSEAGVEDSHFQRFLKIRAEYQALLAARPDFKPGRAAAHNPVMRKPPLPEGKMWINAAPASELLDIGNAIYNHSLRCLALSYTGVDKAAQRSLVNAAIELMRILTPVAERLTALPANEEHPGCTAGLSFATLRSAAALPPAEGAIPVLTERLHQIGARATWLAAHQEDEAELAEVTATQLERLANRLATTTLAPPSVLQPATAAIEETPVIDTPPAPPEPIQADDGRELIPGQSIDLIFDAQRCIHARHCVLGQPKVFKANVEGPWIDPDATTTEGLVTVAHMCPSGAIQYRRHDGGHEEAPPPVNLVQLRENGPIGVRADMLLDGKPIGYRATLCRCGASKNKPFCDSSHIAIGFTATGEPETRESQPLAARGGTLVIEPQQDGPLEVLGNLELCAGTGRTFDRVTSTWLCRCGGSANKPYCDGTHRKIGFKS